MGRTEIAPRPAARPRAGRALAVVLTSLVLLLCGAADVLPRGAAVALAAGPAAAAPPAPVAQAPRGPGAGALEAPHPSFGVRAAALAAVPAPTSPGLGLLPSATPLVAPRLVADPRRRPAGLPAAPGPAGAPGSRAPPGPAGT